MADSDYIPDADAEFNNWQANLVAKVDANATAWDIATEAIAAIKLFQTAWSTAYAKASNNQDRSHSEVRAKNEARDAYEKELRILVGEFLAINRKITNSDRDSMGITVRSGVRIPVSVPTASPMGKVDFSTILKHFIQILDSVTNSKAKPAGVHGCEIWMKVGGEMPKDISEFTFIGVSTKNPFTVNFIDADRGKTVYYRFRWVNKRGQAGPWSTIISAIVAG